MSKEFLIKSIEAYEILDSRGNPTVGVAVELAGGAVGSASVPSGASTGIHEAYELRDGGKRYGGLGVIKAVRNVDHAIQRALKGKDARMQKKLDEMMINIDGTSNKKRLGSNAMLGVSMAIASASSKQAKMPLYKYLRPALGIKTSGWRLPIPMLNILNGGAHADSGLDIQEIMVVPWRINRFSEKMRAGSEVYHALKKLLKSDGFSTGVGDEGGFAPRLKKNKNAFEYVCRAIEKAGYSAGREIGIALDAASSEFYDKQRQVYHLRLDGKKLDTKDMTKMYKEWINKYPIISIEDPLREDDFLGWAALTKEIGKSALVVGDDFFVTNAERLTEGIKSGAANAIIIKPNQAGTLSEAAAAAKLAKSHGYKLMVSHRSGDTSDSFIADLAVAMNAEFIKSGAPCRGERLAKYNRLTEIEHELA